MPMKLGPITYLVCIRHRHQGESCTFGKILAQDIGEAFLKAAPWIIRQKRLCCKLYGDPCDVIIEEPPFTGEKMAILAHLKEIRKPRKK
jgi:hypothetical protein